MASSPGFGSTSCDLRPIQTRFRFGYTYWLNLATQRNSPAHTAKGMRSGKQLVVSWFVVRDSNSGKPKHGTLDLEPRN